MEHRARQPAGLVGEEAVRNPPPLLRQVDPMRPRKFFYVVACLRGSSAIFAGGAAPAAAQADNEPDATAPLPAGGRRPEILDGKRPTQQHSLQQQVL